MSSTTSTATAPRHSFENAVDEVIPSKTDLNKVIMDYLTSEGYPMAAQKFAVEANMQPAPNFDDIQERMEIRDAIHSGDIQTAIEKINELAPQLLDRDQALHFALLRLQLIELIRVAISTPNGDPNPSIDFATTHLAPRAPNNSYFLDDLEQTMVLLFFNPDNIAPQLAPQLDPALRQDIANRVNEAIRNSQTQQTRATLFELVDTRAWAQHQAIARRQEHCLAPDMSLGFDEEKKGGKGAGDQNGGGRGGRGGIAPPQNGASTSSAEQQQQQHNNGSTSATTSTNPPTHQITTTAAATSTTASATGASAGGDAMATDWEGAS